MGSELAIRPRRGRVMQSHPAATGAGWTASASTSHGPRHGPSSNTGTEMVFAVSPGAKVSRARGRRVVRPGSGCDVRGGVVDPHRDPQPPAQEHPEVQGMGHEAELVGIRVEHRYSDSIDWIVVAGPCVAAGLSQLCTSPSATKGTVIVEAISLGQERVKVCVAPGFDGCTCSSRQDWWRKRYSYSRTAAPCLPA